jgi:hypothetical protein
MENILAILSVAFALFVVAAIAVRRIKRFLESRERKRLEAEILSVPMTFPPTPIACLFATL